jgi:hypothetical protein
VRNLFKKKSGTLDLSAAFKADEAAAAGQPAAASTSAAAQQAGGSPTRRLPDPTQPYAQSAAATSAAYMQRFGVSPPSSPGLVGGAGHGVPGPSLLPDSTPSSAGAGAGSSNAAAAPPPGPAGALDESLFAGIDLLGDTELAPPAPAPLPPQVTAATASPGWAQPAGGAASLRGIVPSGAAAAAPAQSAAGLGELEDLVVPPAAAAPPGPPAGGTSSSPAGSMHDAQAAAPGLSNVSSGALSTSSSGVLGHDLRMPAAGAGAGAAAGAAYAAGVRKKKHTVRIGHARESDGGAAGPELSLTHGDGSGGLIPAGHTIARTNSDSSTTNSTTTAAASAAAMAAGGDAGKSPGVPIPDDGTFSSGGAPAQPLSLPAAAPAPRAAAAVHPQSSTHKTEPLKPALSIAQAMELYPAAQPPVTLEGLDASLAALSGAAAARGAAAHQLQQRLLQQLETSSAGIGGRERDLGARKRSLLADVAAQAGRLAELESMQAVAVEGEDFDQVGHPAVQHGVWGLPLPLPLERLATAATAC